MHLTIYAESAKECNVCAPGPTQHLLHWVGGLLPRREGGQSMKVTAQLHLMRRSVMVEWYLHSLILLHGVVFKGKWMKSRTWIFIDVQSKDDAWKINAKRSMSKRTQWPESASELYTERPPLVGEVSQLLRIKGAMLSAWRIPTAVFSDFQTGAAAISSK
jgi:hypothetical protein